MPSHSPYALYSLTFNLVWIIKNQRFLLMLLKFFTLSYILIYFGKTFPHFLCLIIFIYYPWVCIYFILFGLSKYFLAFTLYHRFALFSFQGTKFCWIFFHTPLVNNMCTPLFAYPFNMAHNEVIFRRLCALSDRPIFTTLKNMCIWNRFLFETDFFDVAAYVCTQNREKICFRAKRCPNGGDEEDRTPDPLLARQVLSQRAEIRIAVA